LYQFNQKGGSSWSHRQCGGLSLSEPILWTYAESQHPDFSGFKQEIFMSANTPEEVDKLFIKYMREGDMDKVLTLYDPEVAFVNRAGEVRRGQDALRAELSRFADIKQVFRFDIKKVVQAGDIALVHNQWEMIFPQRMSGYAIEVMRRQTDGTWRFLVGDPFTLGKAYIS
jgi:ketosteroid isomerase-like protein